MIVGFGYDGVLNTKIEETIIQQVRTFTGKNRDEQLIELTSKLSFESSFSIVTFNNLHFKMFAMNNLFSVKTKSTKSVTKTVDLAQALKR